jgi:hypothetical protein
LRQCYGIKQGEIVHCLEELVPSSFMVTEELLGSPEVRPLDIPFYFYNRYNFIMITGAFPSYGLHCQQLLQVFVSTFASFPEGW